MLSVGHVPFQLINAQSSIHPSEQSMCAHLHHMLLCAWLGWQVSRSGRSPSCRRGPLLHSSAGVQHVTQMLRCMVETCCSALVRAHWSCIATSGAPIAAGRIERSGCLGAALQGPVCCKLCSAGRHERLQRLRIGAGQRLHVGACSGICGRVDSMTHCLINTSSASSVQQLLLVKLMVLHCF